MSFGQIICGLRATVGAEYKEHVVSAFIVEIVFCDILSGCAVWESLGT